MKWPFLVYYGMTIFLLCPMAPGQTQISFTEKDDHIVVEATSEFLVAKPISYFRDQGFLTKERLESYLGIQLERNLKKISDDPTVYGHFNGSLDSTSFGLPIFPITIEFQLTVRHFEALDPVEGLTVITEETFDRFTRIFDRSYGKVSYQQRSAHQTGVKVYQIFYIRTSAWSKLEILSFGSAEHLMTTAIDQRLKTLETMEFD